MNLLRLTDSKLAALLCDVKTEAGRRTKAATTDAASIIKGHEMAKRAITIAAAGQHSLLLVGPKGTGKTMLRALAMELGLSETFEARTCPCGFFNDPMNDCCCTKSQVAKHRDKWPAADMTIEVGRVPARDLASRLAGTSAGYMQNAIDCMGLEPGGLDEHGPVLLKAAMNELGLTAAGRETIIRVAATIASLDNSRTITTTHLSEAINYSCLTLRLH